MVERRRKYGLVVILFLIVFPFSVLSQKSRLDTSVLGKWPIIPEASIKITNDGNYASYSIGASSPEDDTVFFNSLDNNWKKNFSFLRYSAAFTADSKNAVFKTRSDSLVILKLGTDSIEYIPGVRDYRLFFADGKPYLAYYELKNNKTLVIRDIESTNSKKITNTINYFLNKDEKKILLQREEQEEGRKFFLECFDNANRDLKRIWTGRSAVNPVFDERSGQICFISTIKENPGILNVLWYYKEGMDSAVSILNDHSPGIDSPLSINSRNLMFSKAGDKIFLSLKEADRIKPLVLISKVDVWSHSDNKLQSEQLGNISEKYFRAVVDINSHKVQQLEFENDRLFEPPANQVCDDYFLLSHRSGNGFEWNWNKAARADIYLVDVKDGTRHLISKELEIGDPYFYYLSPNCRWLIYYSRDSSNYFSVDVGKFSKHNISSKVSANWSVAPGTFQTGENRINTMNLPSGVAGWKEGDSAVLIYDQNDIWEIGLYKESSRNLTNGFGRKKGIIFRIGQQNKIVTGNEQLILNSFSRSTKESGFYKTVIGSNDNPERLLSGPFIFNHGLYFSFPLKAKDRDRYIICRRSATESLNLFSTSDFRNFLKISDNYPERKFNWITNELVKWESLNNRSLEGVLYKPEDFDPKKKYPVIMNVYERLSNRLNEYFIPEGSSGDLNIPFFVSNGYLVLTPDIEYKIGSTGKSIYNAVVSAAKYLGSLPWVDKNRIGICGHSFGGYEVNYIVAHSNLFAAAVSASGICDFVSFNGQLRNKSISNQFQQELSQNRLGGSLWQAPERYIDNSPIFKTNQINTPLLLMNNKLDEAVDFAQGVEFFTSLRRLGKKCWLLQYDDEGHQLRQQPDQIDFLIRMNQFFDHYLINAPPPKWMTQGIPAKLKQVETRYESDPAGNCGKDCKVCKMWNDKMRKNAVATLKEMEAAH